MSIGELFRLKRTLFQEQLRTIRLYYPKSFRFALIDLLFALTAFCQNPYRTSRKFHERKGFSNPHLYGETPFSTLETIARECHLTPDDTVLELGSGRGKGCFWLSTIIGCTTIGYEWVPAFYTLSNTLKRLFRIPNLSFREHNYQTFPLEKATFVYLYSTALSNEALLQISQKLRKVPKVLTISAPLPDRAPIHTFPVTFPWGTTTAYLH